MNKNLLVKRWVSDLVKHGFMHGWFGDRSAAFKKRQISDIHRVLNGDINLVGGNARLLATIYGDYGNLKKYCGWNEKSLNELLGLFGFKDIGEVIAVLNSNDRDILMDRCRLRGDVRFRLEPWILETPQK